MVRAVPTAGLAQLGPSIVRVGTVNDVANAVFLFRLIQAGTARIRLTAEASGNAIGESLDIRVSSKRRRNLIDRAHAMWTLPLLIATLIFTRLLMRRAPGRQLRD
jgi:hypothetical protein